MSRILEVSCSETTSANERKQGALVTKAAVFLHFALPHHCAGLATFVMETTSLPVDSLQFHLPGGG